MLQGVLVIATFDLGHPVINLLKNLTPPYSWSRIESNEFGIDFHRIFLIIFHLLNQSNQKFSNRKILERIQHLKNLTPPYSWS